MALKPDPLKEAEFQKQHELLYGTGPENDYSILTKSTPTIGASFGIPGSFVQTPTVSTPAVPTVPSLMDDISTFTDVGQYVNPIKPPPTSGINDAITAVKNATAGNNSLINQNVGGFPSIPNGITMGGAGIGGVSNQSADVWDYLKNFQMPNNFEAPNTDAPKVGWGV